MSKTANSSAPAADPSGTLQQENMNEAAKEYKDLDASSEQKSEAEEFDYIVPGETYEHRQKKRRRKRKASKRSDKTHDLLDEAVEGYVFATPVKKKHKKHRKKRPLWLKILLSVVSVILVLALTVTAAFFIMKEIGRKSMHNFDNIDIEIPIRDDGGKETAGIMDKGRTIKYNGKTYRLNEDVMTVTFIGYNEGEVGENDQYLADAIYIVAIDDYRGKTTILGVSRDTISDVDVYSASGQFIDTEKLQLSYAYSYGNSAVTGGKNLNATLTRLFFGLPLNNYFAINLEALEELNDAIGGVTLTSQIPFESAYYGRTIQQGEEVTLHGSDAAHYVQTREFDPVDANNERMNRQQQYIKAFLASIVPAAKKDLSTITNLYGVVSDNSDSSLGLPEVTYLASNALSKMRNADEIEYIRLDGKIKAGEHAEMYLDDTDVLETMLSVFYTPVE